MDLCIYYRLLTKHASDPTAQAWCAHPSVTPSGVPADDAVMLTCDGKHHEEGRCPIKHELEREGYL
jgi:hypothetical protein